jgi:rhodanese-related sulfurtransferase
VDPYPYEDTWERVPLDAINDYYYISGSLLERLGPGTVIKEGCLVLDLRQPFDFTAWHLPGAINFPLRSLRSSTTSPFKDPNILEEQWLELEETFRDASVLSKLHDYRVLLVCYDGDTSRVATSVLQAKGVSAENIRGGYGAITELVRKEVGIHDQLRRDLILPVEKAMIITTETELVTSEGTG